MYFFKYILTHFTRKINNIFVGKTFQHCGAHVSLHVACRLIIIFFFSVNIVFEMSFCAFFSVSKTHDDS